MNSILNYLNIALVFLTAAKTTFKLDALQPIIDEINKFISTHPVAPSTVAKGYTATLAFCNSILQQLDVLITSPLPKQERLVLANHLVADLSDDNKVYPAKNGNDARVLTDSKAKAKSKFEIIKNQ